MDIRRAGRVGALRVVRGAGLDMRAKAGNPLYTRTPSDERTVRWSCRARLPARGCAWGLPAPWPCACTPFALLLDSLVPCPDTAPGAESARDSLRPDSIPLG